jgi:hypothetical protein
VSFFRFSLARRSSLAGISGSVIFGQKIRQTLSNS